MGSGTEDFFLILQSYEVRVATLTECRGAFIYTNTPHIHTHKHTHTHTYTNTHTHEHTCICMPRVFARTHTRA
jgi:hypothetical protein